MKSAGTPHRASYGKMISFAIIAIGVAVGFYVAHISSIRPSTDDATIDADVVHVAERGCRRNAADRRKGKRQVADG